VVGALIFVTLERTEVEKDVVDDVVEVPTLLMMTEKEEGTNYWRHCCCRDIASRSCREHCYLDVEWSWLVGD